MDKIDNEDAAATEIETDKTLKMNNQPTDDAETKTYKMNNQPPPTDDAEIDTEEIKLVENAYIYLTKN